MNRHSKGWKDEKQREHGGLGVALGLVALLALATVLLEWYA